MPNASVLFSLSSHNANQRRKMLAACGPFPDTEEHFQSRNSLGGNFDLLFSQTHFLTSVSSRVWLFLALFNCLSS